jgi:hypothetical protein
MAEDGPAQPLPRRAPSSNKQVPGGKQGPRARPVRPPVLSQDAVQRIRDALDSVRAEASPQEQAPRAERPASLPRRTPGAGKTPQPPAVTARPRLPSPRPPPLRSPRLSPLRSAADEAPTAELPALSISSHLSGTEEIMAQPEPHTARPEPDTAQPVDPPSAPAPPLPVPLRPARQDRTDGATGLPEKPPGRRKNKQGRLAKESARRIKMSAVRAKADSRRTKTPAIASRPERKPRPSGPPKQARREAPGSPSEPTPQMALLFPEDPAPEEATAPPSALMWPQWARSGRRFAWLILALVIVAGGSLAVLLAR